MVDWARWHHKYNITARTRGRHFLIGPRVADCAPTPLAGATTLRIATLALVHSTAGYWALVWCRSTHTRLIDPAINDALRIVTGCLHPTPMDNIPILPGIQPAELRRSEATLP